MRAPPLVTSALRSLLSLGRLEVQPFVLRQSASLAEGSSSVTAKKAYTPPCIWLPAPSICGPDVKQLAEQASVTASATAKQLSACLEGSAAASACSSTRSTSRAEPRALPFSELPTKEAQGRWATAPARQHSWLQRVPLPAARRHPLQLYSPSHGTRAGRWFATRSASRPLPPPPLSPPQGSGIEGVKHIVAVASGKGGVGKSTTAGTPHRHPAQITAC